MDTKNNFSERVTGAHVRMLHSQEREWSVYKSLPGAAPAPVYVTNAQGGVHNMMCVPVDDVALGESPMARWLHDVASGESSTACWFTGDNSVCMMSLDGEIDTTKSGAELIAKSDPSKILCQDDTEWKLVSPVDVDLGKGDELSDKYTCIHRPGDCWNLDKVARGMPSCNPDQGTIRLTHCIRDDTDEKDSWSLFYGEPGVRVTESTSPDPPAYMFHTDNGSYQLLVRHL